AQAPCSGGLALDQLDGAVERVSDLTSGCRAMPPEAPAAFQDGTLFYEAPAAFQDGTLLYEAPAAFQDGTLLYEAPAAFQDGTLLYEAPAFQDGSIPYQVKTLGATVAGVDTLCYEAGPGDETLPYIPYTEEAPDATLPYGVCGALARPVVSTIATPARGKGPPAIHEPEEAPSSVTPEK
ncbi:unnamed protein product, partial [Effrenium voratum]